MRKIIIVNEEDEVIGTKDRDKVTKDDIYRVSILWLENKLGQVLLTRRATGKRFARRWGPTVAGTVEKGETYLENIKKEIKEELGLENIDFIPILKTRDVVDGWDYFVKVFYAKVKINIASLNIKKDEVGEVRWFNVDTLVREIQNDDKRFLPAFDNLVSKIIDASKKID